MKLITGSWTLECGHTWLARGFGKVYSLRSLAGGSFLCVDGKEYPTPGEHSCHITLLPKEAVVADYTSGTLSIYPLGADGIPSGEPRLLHFGGSGPVTGRQEGPHIHSSWLSPDRGALVVVDLGADKLYRFQVSGGTLSMDGIEAFPMPEGCGPRHCAFGRHKLYVATELSDEVFVLDWPSMELRQRITVNDQLPGGGGHILLSPDGKYLYASSRLKNDGIGVFAIKENGLLEKAGYQTTGAHPRHFCMSPDGGKLLVACRDSDRIEYYDRNPNTGLLSPTEEIIQIEKPVFVQAYEED